MEDLTPGDEQFATPQEVRSAIQNLQNADYSKLMIIAKHFAKYRLKGTVSEPGDLLHRAIVKTIDGRRHWNRQFSIVKHLDRVMESDSSHEAERAARDFSQRPKDNVELVDRQPSPEARLLSREALKDPLNLFAGDEIALKLLHLRSDDLSASEIQLALNIKKVEYDTVTRRIRRRVAKYLDEGSK